MQKEILINVESQEKRVAVVVGNVLQDYYVERPQAVGIVGNIYKGIVKSIVPGIGAAFVDIGYSKHGFLYVADIISPSNDFDLLGESGSLHKQSIRPKASDIQKHVCEGQELLVQVVKESIGNKGPRLTTHIGLPGRFVVFMPFDRHIGISKKVTDHTEREKLWKILKKLDVSSKMGIIVRTVGVGRSERDFRRELRYLYVLWGRIMQSAEKSNAPCLIHKEHDLTFRILRDIFSENVSRVLVDDRDEYRRLRHFADTIMPSMKKNLMLYKQRISLFESRGIEREIEKLYSKRIGLECKGYIVIEETEGLIAIDVNSGSFARKNVEETAFKVNYEAALEIARQIHLRDIGGIIIIDFIDMNEERHRQEIFKVLSEAFKYDRAKIKILKMSEFGIVEITRQRIRKGVKSVSYINCPYCGGKGVVKSVATVSIEVLRAIRKVLDKGGIKEIRSSVHPSVANYLLNENRDSVTELESQYKAKIIIIAETDMHMERFMVG